MHILVVCQMVTTLLQRKRAKARERRHAILHAVEVRASAHLAELQHAGEAQLARLQGQMALAAAQEQAGIEVGMSADV